MKVIPSVELILSNHTNMFTSYSNLVPGTNNLNCYDPLLTATNNPALSNQSFHTLKCFLPDNVFGADMVIDMEFEIE